VNSVNQTQSIDLSGEVPTEALQILVGVYAFSEYCTTVEAAGIFQLWSNDGPPSNNQSLTIISEPHIPTFAGDMLWVPIGPERILNVIFTSAVPWRTAPKTCLILLEIYGWK
jgi:hypothetical protein